MESIADSSFEPFSDKDEHNLGVLLGLDSSLMCSERRAAGKCHSGPTSCKNFAVSSWPVSLNKGVDLRLSDALYLCQP